MDGDNVDALVGVGTVDTIVGVGLVDNPASTLAAAEASLAKALKAAPNHAFAHRMMGMLLCQTNRVSRGIEELERALAIDPNLARARANVGVAQAYLGRAAETEAHVLEALRMSPRDAYVFLWLMQVGFAKACLGEHEEAVSWMRKSVDANRNNPWVYFNLAASLANLGRLDEARQEVKAGLAVDPKYTIRRFRVGNTCDNPVFSTQRDRLIEGMRLAGVPEE